MSDLALTNGLTNVLNGGIINANKTYSYKNNSLFYASANRTWIDYYNYKVKRNLEWYDGYVPDFHLQINGIFSTRLAHALVTGASKSICGSKILFKGKNKTTIENISKWSKKTRLQEKIKTASEYAIAGGTSLLKLNQSGGTLWCDAIRIDFFNFSIDGVGELQEVQTAVNCYQSTLASNENYYLVEKRYFEQKENKRVPYVVFQIQRMLLGQNDSPKLDGVITWEKVPPNIREIIKRDYGAMQISVPQRLPFLSLGCYALKYDTDTTVPTCPLGISALEDIQSDLLYWDFAFSCSVLDTYQGRGKVLIPKGMSAQSFSDTPYGGLNKSLFEQFDSTDPDKQKPVSVQFELRADQWALIKDDILKRIATKWQMSPRTVASYLPGASTQVTATEINADYDITLAYIEYHRSILEQPLNEMLEDVCNFMGMADSVAIQFATPNLVNKNEVLNRVKAEYADGAISEEEYLQAIFPDDDYSTIAEKAEKMRNRIQERSSFSAFQQQDDGGGSL